MPSILWFDFSHHNALHHTNTRALAVNHPQAGRLVVFKGVDESRRDALVALGFSRSKDGSYVIRAAELNARALKSQVYPELAMSQQSLAEIDLTSVWLGRASRGQENPGSQERPTAPTVSPAEIALQWLKIAAKEVVDSGAQLTRFSGVLPSTLANPLFAAITSSDQNLPDGRQAYQGQVDGRFYLLLRSEPAPGQPEDVTFFLAPTPEALPSITAPPVPALFVMSDILQSRLASATNLYSLKSDATGPLYPDRAVAEHAAQLQGGLEHIAVYAPARHVFLIAEDDYRATVPLAALLAVIPESEHGAFLSGLPDSAWSEGNRNDTNSLLHAHAVAKNPALRAVLDTLGYEAVAYYSPVPGAPLLKSEPADAAFVNVVGQCLHLEWINSSRTPIAELPLESSLLEAEAQAEPDDKSPSPALGDNATVTPEPDPVGDLFTAESHPETHDVELRLEPGSSPSSIVVKGAGIVPMASALEELGGRFVASQQGFRFKKGDEYKVREWLAGLSRSGREKGQVAIQFSDLIRVPYNLSKGTRLTHRRPILEVIDIQDAVDPFITLRADDSQSANIQRTYSYKISEIEQALDIQVLNAAHLIHQARNTVDPVEQADPGEVADAKLEAAPTVPRALFGRPVRYLGTNTEGERVFEDALGVRLRESDTMVVSDHPVIRSDDSLGAPPAPPSGLFSVTAGENEDAPGAPSLSVIDRERVEQLSAQFRAVPTLQSFVDNLSDRDLHLLPSHQVHERLERAMSEGDYAGFSLFVARLYGTEQELLDVRQGIDGASAEGLERLALDVESQFAARRTAIELPGRILHLQSLSQENLAARAIGAVATPRQLVESSAIRTSLDALLAEYSNFIHSVDDIPITPTLTDIYRSGGSLTEIHDSYRQMLGLDTRASARLAKRVRENIEAEAAERRSPDTHQLLQLAAHLPTSIPLGNQGVRWLRNGEFLALGDEVDSEVTAFQFPYRRSIITVDRLKPEDSGAFTWCISRGDQVAFVTYPSRPTVATQLRDLLSNLALEQYSQVNRAAAPTFGSRRDELLNVTDSRMASISMSLRAVIKKAVAAGDLPPGLTVSVRTGTGDVRITISTLPDSFPLISPLYIAWREKLDGVDLDDEPEMYHPEGEALLDVLADYANAWNSSRFDETEQVRVQDYSVDIAVDPSLMERLSVATPERLAAARSIAALEQQLNREHFLVRFQGFAYTDNRRLGLRFTPEGLLTLEDESEQIVAQLRTNARAGVEPIDDLLSSLQTPAPLIRLDGAPVRYLRVDGDQALLAQTVRSSMSVIPPAELTQVTVDHNPDGIHLLAIIPTVDGFAARVASTLSSDAADGIVITVPSAPTKHDCVRQLARALDDYLAPAVANRVPLAMSEGLYLFRALRTLDDSSSGPVSNLFSLEELKAIEGEPDALNALYETYVRAGETPATTAVGDEDFPIIEAPVLSEYGVDDEQLEYMHQPRAHLIEYADGLFGLSVRYSAGDLLDVSTGPRRYFSRHEALARLVLALADRGREDLANLALTSHLGRYTWDTTDPLQLLRDDYPPVAGMNGRISAGALAALETWSAKVSNLSLNVSLAEAPQESEPSEPGLLVTHIEQGSANAEQLCSDAHEGAPEGKAITVDGPNFRYAHAVSLYRDRGRYHAALSTTLPSGEHAGVVVQARHYYTPQTALMGLAGALDAYLDLTASPDPSVVVESLALFVHVEQLSDARSPLTDRFSTEQRRIALAGGDALLAYHQRLTQETGAANVIAEESRTVDIPRLGPVEVTTALESSGDVALGIRFLDQPINLPITPSSQRFPSTTAALMAFVLAIQDVTQDASIPRQLIAEWYPELGEAFPDMDSLWDSFPEPQSISTPDSPLRKLVEMFRTLDNDQATPALTVLRHLEEHSDTEHYQVDLAKLAMGNADADALKQLAITHGGIEDNGSIYFAALDDLERFVARAGITCALEVVPSAPAIQHATVAHEGLLPSSTQDALESRGYVRSEFPNTWVIGAGHSDDNAPLGSVAVEFFPGLVDGTLDLRIRYHAVNGSGETRETAHHTGEPRTLSPEDIDQRVMQLLSKMDAVPVRHSEQPVSVDPETACATLLAAGINLEYLEDGDQWRISGNTYPYRNTLAHLGGEYVGETQKPYWLYRRPPLQRVASALKEYVSVPASNVFEVGEARMQISFESGPQPFTVRFADVESSWNPPERALFHRDSNLFSARLAAVRALIEPYKPAPEVPHDDQQTPTGGEVPVLPGINATDVVEDAGLQQPSVAGEPKSRSSGNLAEPRRGIHRKGDGQDLGDSSSNARSGGESGAVPASATSLPREILGDDDAAERLSRDIELFDLNSARARVRYGNDEMVTYTFDALRLLLTLRDDRRAPTQGEKAVLARMVGLGAGVFSANDGGVFSNFAIAGESREQGALRRLINRLDTNDKRSLTETVLTAFYTPAYLTQFMWDALSRMGVSADTPRRSLSVCEPAAGTGHFIGAAPEFIRRTANILAVEADTLTAEIAQHLYPEARVVCSEFQQLLLPENSQDIVVGNPPYSDVRVFNPRTKSRELVHDMFLRESIRLLRPGGLLAFVTSAGTLDKEGASVRREIAQSSDLLYALRLPNDAFDADAGTRVMTDVLFFRKRREGEPALSSSWVNTTSVSFAHPKAGEPIDGEGDVYPDSIELSVNNYYLKRPGNVLGSLSPVSSQFGYRLGCKGRDGWQQELLNHIEHLPNNVFKPIIVERESARRVLQRHAVSADLSPDLRVGSLFVDPDTGAVRVYGFDAALQQPYAVDFSCPAKTVPMVKAYLSLRDLTKSLLHLELNAETPAQEESLESLRSELNQQYDGFVAAFGPLGRKENLRYLRKDPDVFTTTQLEFYDSDTDVAEKADILKGRVLRAKEVARIAATPQDAVLISMDQFGYVNTEFIANQLSRPWPEIAHELGDAIYFDPERSHYTTATVYLSGDVISKREAAERALPLRPEMSRNIAALIAATPTPIPLDQVNIKLGATWIPQDAITDFVRSLLRADTYSYRDKCVIRYNETIGTWNIAIKDSVLNHAATENNFTYGTKRVPFHKLLRHCLEQTRPSVWDEDDEGNRYLNETETQAARDKQSEIESLFREFVFSNDARASEMETAYNHKMNRIVLAKPDGLHLTFPGMAAEFKGRPLVLGAHQLSVIEHAITSPDGTLIAHEAGAGKTISKVCIAMKFRQLGIARKPLIAVPNHMLIQYTEEAMAIYPSARILAVSQEDLTPEGRLAFAAKVSMNDWDIVIATHEQFTRMKMPPSFVQDVINDELMVLQELLENAKADKERASIKDIQAAIKRARERLREEIGRAESHKDDIDFTALGIDAILYDESHYLKNRAYPTRNGSLSGVNTTTSQRALDADMKFAYLRQRRGESRGIVLASGTPISNTIGEFYVSMRYLAPDLLDSAGISHFDAFIAAFGEVRSHIELTADGSGYQMKERLSRYHNVPELVRLFRQVADIRMGDDLNLERPEAIHVRDVSDLSPEQRLFMDWLTHRVVAIKGGSVPPSEDNYLKIYNDLQTISVDPRLIHPALADVEDSKVNRQVDTIYRNWVEGENTRDVQLIFCDRFQKTEKVLTGSKMVKGVSVPKYQTRVVFNLFDDMRAKLIARGIPADQIAKRHDASTDQEKEQLYAKMRAGTVRICFATTNTMGVGTNAQTRGKDLYHLSYPMRSIDVEQRNKRFVRQHNMNTSVRLHYPTTRDSGDLATLQMLDRKDKMTRQILCSPIGDVARTFDEDFEPTYEELMAITTGNPFIKEKLEVDLAVDELRRKRDAHFSRCYRARADARLALSTVPVIEDRIATGKSLAARVAPADGFLMTVKGKPFKVAKQVGAECHRLAATMSLHQRELTIGEHRGIPLLITRTNNSFYLTLDTSPNRISVPFDENLSWFPSRLAHNVNDALEEIARDEERLADLISDAERLKAIGEEDWGRDDELERLIARQAELNEELFKLEEERKAASPSNDSAGPHPFEQLLQKLDGGDSGTQGYLSEHDIELALTREESQVARGELDAEENEHRTSVSLAR